MRVVPNQRLGKGENRVTLIQGEASQRLICVHTTLGDADAAAALARGLVEARLAACVQVTPIRSTYRWQSAVEVADEQLLTIKTAAQQLDALTAYLGAHHPYDEPELIVLPVETASAGYAAWVHASVER